MSKLALRVEKLGKRYRLGGSAWDSRYLYHRLGAWLKPRGARAGAGEARDLFWALRDVAFEVAPGEVVGIVGRNGAGKSTLLKILSRITPPTEGRAVVRGSLASLLEVGTGFHPELTGRENIFLNGVILGMSRRQVAARFDEIVAFSEIAAFLDTPVKRYSSGMYVRLAFAVAAHLDADVVLVDEILAVGDLEFQRKCLGKMESVAASGRTVLFVSHNLGAIRNLCPRVLLIDQGRLVLDGPAELGLARYEASAAAPGGAIEAAGFSGPLAGEIRFGRFVLRQNEEPVLVVDPGLPVAIEVAGEALRSFSSLDVAVGVFRDGHRLFTCHDGPPGQPLPEGPFRSTFEVPGKLLRPGRYSIGFGAHRPGLGEWAWSPHAALFEVSERWQEGLDARDEGALSVAYRGSRAVG